MGRKRNYRTSGMLKDRMSIPFDTVIRSQA